MPAVGGKIVVEDGNMVSDFLGAAFPWIVISLFVEISCSLMGNKKNKFPKPTKKRQG